MLGFLIFCAMACVYIYLWFYTRRGRNFLGHLPTFSPLPLIGNAHQALGDGKYMMKSLMHLSKITEELQMPFLFWIGPTPVVIISDPNEVKTATNAFVEKPYFYGFARDLLDNGLLIAPGAIWKQNIKKLANTFSVSVVDGYQEIFNGQARKLVDKLKLEAGGGPVDVGEKYLMYNFLEAICQTALGTPKNVSEGIVTTEIYKSLEKGKKLIIDRLMNLLYHFDFVYHLTPSCQEFTKLKNTLNEFCDQIIHQKKTERENLKKINSKTITETKTKFQPFINMLLDMQESDPSLSDKYLRSEVFTVIMGGSDTTSVALFLTLIMIAKHPEVQEKLYAEIKDVLGDSKRPVQKEDLSQMPYCEAVVKETLRLHPPVPFVIRDADQDLKLEKCTIPKGTGCGINIWGSNRLKSVWGQDAHEFRPGRWLDGSCTDQDPLFAFSFGRRACLGKKYAMPIVMTTLAYCVRELEFKSDDEDLVLAIDITVKALKGHLLQINLRE